MSEVSWDKIKDLVDSVLAVPAERRGGYLDLHCTDPQIRHSIEALIDSYEESSKFFREPAIVTHLENESCWVGRRVGPYKILEEVGAGGMGVVYRGARDDDEYSQQVAIKVVGGVFASRAHLERFRIERQILADLNHPNIARLVDGGTTPEGFPFLVMEFIEGIPINKYCDTHRLPLRKRLELFLQVCGAVQFAHENLVVHRDLKPGNILVGKGGTPKLLDFGIAKILQPMEQGSKQEQTIAALRVMTPEYASPEQLEERQITTASDVYSLGVVLYGLAAGNWPYVANSNAPDDIVRAVKLQTPRRPSTVIGKADGHTDTSHGNEARRLIVAEAFGESVSSLRNQLTGDLDAIILRSLERDLVRRYRSTEQFANDIRRFLEGRPVEARLPTVSYRAAKFVRRNTIAVSVAIAVAIASLVAVAWIIRAERIANRERARAEQRFNDVRSLANSLIFDIHDSIKDLPGSTPARKMIVDRALKYLDSLSTESPGDASLQRELATAYQRVAMVQGDTRSASLGDTAGSLATLLRAQVIWERLAKSNPGNVDDQINLAYGHRLIANLYGALGKPGVHDQMTQALAIVEPLSKLNTTNSRLHRELEREYIALADVENDQGNLNQALEDMQRAGFSIQEGSSASPGDLDLKRSLAIVETKIGDLLEHLGRRDEALKHVRHSLDIYQTLAADPTHATARREMGVVLFKQGEILIINAEPTTAMKSFKRGIELVEPLTAADPNNELFGDDVSGFRIGLAFALVAAGHVPEGLSQLARESPRLEQEVDRGTPSQWACNVLAADQIWQGDALGQMGRFGPSINMYRQAVVTNQKCSRTSEDAFAIDVNAVSHLKIGSALSHSGRSEPAFAEYQKALALVAASAGQANPQALYTQAQAYAGLGDVELSRSHVPARCEQIAHLKKAQSYYQRSRDSWKQVNNPGAMSPSGFLCGNPRQVQKKLKRCDAALDRVLHPPLAGGDRSACPES